MINNDEILVFEGKQYPFFPSIGLKLTGACRLNCPFCCEPNRKQKVYDLKHFIKITNLLHKLKTSRLCFTGGDPLLYPWLEHLLKHTKHLGFFNLLLTGDGSLISDMYERIFPYLSAVRFSIHNLDSEHDKIVQHDGAFSEMENALDQLAQKKVPCFITTVVTPLNFNSVADIADWCFKKKIKKFFLFGLMRSGKGDGFINTTGEVPKNEIENIIAQLKNKYSPDQLDIIYYDYKKNAECILIYGDGKVVIDPYPKPPKYQMEIGNILHEKPVTIIKRFNQDPENHKGHYEHLKRYYIDTHENI